MSIYYIVCTGGRAWRMIGNKYLNKRTKKILGITNGGKGEIKFWFPEVDVRKVCFHQRALEVILSQEHLQWDLKDKEEAIRRSWRIVAVVQLLSCVLFFATPWTATHQASLPFNISRSLLKLMSIESVMSSNHLILCHPLLLLPFIFLSIRVFSKNQLFALGGQSIGVSASASVFPMNIQGWFSLGLLVWFLYSPRDSQESSLNHSLKASILQHSAFFMVQPSHPYITAGKSIVWL